MLNKYNLNDIVNNKLTPIKYLCYNLLYEAYKYTINNYNDESTIDYVLKIYDKLLNISIKNNQSKIKEFSNTHNIIFII